MTSHLIQRSQDGDRQAFAALFHQYKNLVYKTAYLMLDSPQEAEDALQEVFVQVYRSIHRYDPSKGAFTTWLHRVTMNHCLNCRQRGRLRRWFGGQTTATTATAPSPEEQLANEAVRQSLQHLNDKHRTIIVLRYYHELSYLDIAQILDIPLGTMKSRLNQALQTLRKHLESDFPDHAAHAATQELSL
jgi:RNA polymerase sigma-70 factor (ECF subfamily)